MLSHMFSTALLQTNQYLNYVRHLKRDVRDVRDVNYEINPSLFF